MKPLLFNLFFLFFFATPSASANIEIEKNCRIEGYPFAIECGSFNAQDSWQGTQQPIQLKWYRVKSRAKYPQDTPIVWMPEVGTNSSSSAPSIISALTRLRSHYDIIWLEVRGSQPQELSECRDKAVPPFSARIYRYADQPFLRQCQQQINLLGGIQKFSNEKFARDYEQLKKHLNIKQVIVLADGKSSAIALSWHHLYSSSIKAMVFDSPTQLTPLTEKSLFNKAKAVHEVMQLSFKACASSIHCHKKYPNPEKNLQQIIEQLPLKVRLKDPLTSQYVNVEITHELFHGMMNNVIRVPNKTVLLPMLLSHAAKGNWQAMIGIESLSWSKRTSTFNYGLHLAQQCLNHHISNANLNISPNLPKSFEEWFVINQTQKLREHCGQLRVSHQDTEASINRLSLPPTLILSGGLDPAKELPEKQKNISFIDVANAGAGVNNYPCTKDIAYRFIRLVSQDKIKDHQMDQNEALCLANIPYPSNAWFGQLEDFEND